MRGNNSEKKVILIGLLGVVILALAGCCTCRRNRGDATDVIAGNSRATGKLEATVQALDGTVANSRERIKNIVKTSRDIADGVDRVEYLFGQYEQEVKRLLNEIDGIRNEARKQVENNSGGNGSTTILYRNKGILVYSENQVWCKDTLLAESSALNLKK